MKTYTRAFMLAVLGWFAAALLATAFILEATMSRQ
jgi:hypothetical protein